MNQATGVPQEDRSATSGSADRRDTVRHKVATDVRPDHDTYVKVILNSISERQRWRAQYEAAKTASAGLVGPVDGVSTVAQPP